MCRMEGFVLKANESEAPLHCIQVVCEDFSLAAGAAVNISARGHAGKAKTWGFGPARFSS